jgi:aldose 1-epimerase
VSLRVPLQAGELTVELAPQIGGSIAAFRHAGRPVMRDAPADFSDVLEAASFPLVPFVNRVRGGRFRFREREIRLAPNLPPQKHPLHGQGWRGSWSVVRAQPEGAELAFGHEPGEWPWAYEARQVFALDERGLSIDLEVINISGEVMPAGLGQHPYFPANSETVLSTQVTEVLTVDDEVMPVGLEPATGRYDLHERRIERAGLDNGYEGWSGLAELRWPDRSLTLRITASDNARRFQVYAPEEGGVVVAEPVTHANDAFSHPEERWASLGLVLLEPGAAMTMTARFEVSAG